jgi:hypothetical protein
LICISYFLLCSIFGMLNIVHFLRSKK